MSNAKATDERIRIIERLVKQYRALDEAWESVRDFVQIEHPTREQSYRALEMAIDFAAELIGDVEDWIDWFIWETDCGDDARDAGEPGEGVKMRKIRTPRQLVKLIDELDRAEKRRQDEAKSECDETDTQNENCMEGYPPLSEDAPPTSDKRATPPKPLVYIASPYTRGDPEANVRRAERFANKLLDAGFHVYCPLSSHYLHNLQERDYEEWLEQDLAFVGKCDALVRLRGESPGADREVTYATGLGVPVFFAGFLKSSALVGNLDDSITSEMMRWLGEWRHEQYLNEARGK